MTPGDLRRVISALDVAPLGAAPERGFRPSLAGFQRKALPGRAADGTWQLPYGDAPSTWILKPGGPHPMAASEATCLRLAAACGLAVPEAELLDVAGLPVLAVRRYDRHDPADGDLPVRVHQEDGCQATATPPGLKYEEQGGPALRDLAGLLRNFGEPPRRNKPPAPHDVLHGRRQRGRACQEFLRTVRPGQSGDQARAAV
jgi:serine/threonine-protein kinase HipA